MLQLGRYSLGSFKESSRAVADIEAGSKTGVGPEVFETPVFQNTKLLLTLLISKT
jgi:hypothetical protein